MNNKKLLINFFFFIKLLNNKILDIYIIISKYFYEYNFFFLNLPILRINYSSLYFIITIIYSKRFFFLFFLYNED